MTWGRGNRRDVNSVAELDRALDEATDVGWPQVVGVYPPEQLDTDASPWDHPRPPALQIGLGRPDRSFVLWLGPEAAIGSEPGAPPWPDRAAPIAFDYGGDPIFCGPDRARVTPPAARAAARLYATTGQRPTNLHWTDQVTPHTDAGDLPARLQLKDRRRDSPPAPASGGTPTDIEEAHP